MWGFKINTPEETHFNHRTKLVAWINKLIQQWEASIAATFQKALTVLDENWWGNDDWLMEEMANQVYDEVEKNKPTLPSNLKKL